MMEENIITDEFIYIYKQAVLTLLTRRGLLKENELRLCLETLKKDTEKC